MGSYQDRSMTRMSHIQHDLATLPDWESPRDGEFVPWSYYNLMTEEAFRDDPYFFVGNAVNSTVIAAESSHMQNFDPRYLQSGTTENHMGVPNVVSTSTSSLPNEDFNCRGRQQSAALSHPASRARSVEPIRTFVAPPARPRSTTTVGSAALSALPYVPPVQPFSSLAQWNYLSPVQTLSTISNPQSSPSFANPLLSNMDACVDRTRLDADYTQTSRDDSVVAHMIYPMSSEAIQFTPGQRRKVATDAVANAAKLRRKHPVKFKCSWKDCSSDFTTKHNLKNHLNSHLGLRQHQCNRCSRTFGVAHVLVRHRKKCRDVDSN